MAGAGMGVPFREEMLAATATPRAGGSRRHFVVRIRLVTSDLQDLRDGAHQRWVP